MKKYRIVKEVWYDKNAKADNPYYTVQEYIESGRGIFKTQLWVDVTYRMVGPFDVMNVSNMFATEKAAEDFIMRLYEGAIIQGSKKTVIKEV